MNKQKMAFQFRLILMGLITISCVGVSCTSLQQTTVATTDDLYYTPNNKETPSRANNDVARNDNRYNQNDEEQGEYQDYQSYDNLEYLTQKSSAINKVLMGHASLSCLIEHIGVPVVWGIVP